MKGGGGKKTLQVLEAALNVSSQVVDDDEDDDGDEEEVSTEGGITIFGFKSRAHFNPKSLPDSLAEFKKAVRQKLRIEDNVPFVITDFDRKELTDDMYAAYTNDQASKKRPKMSPKLWALSAKDSQVDYKGDMSDTIRYDPHYETLTKSGQAHFSQISHALAEFIDNALQATSANAVDHKDIKIMLSLPKKEGKSCFVIADNGKGMDRKGLQTFCTYFLSKEARGERPKEEDKTFDTNGFLSGYISKFGVGANEAGFYIGTQMTVVTKVKENPDVREVTVSEAEYKKRYDNKQNIYEDKMKIRRRTSDSDYVNSSLLNEPLTKVLQEFEEENDSFTYVILVIRDHHVHDLKATGGRVVRNDICRIYHYFLHPEHFPSTAAGRRVGNTLTTYLESTLSSRSASSVTSLSQAAGGGSGGGGAASKQLANAAVNMTFYLCEGGTTGAGAGGGSSSSGVSGNVQQWRLRDVTDDLESQFISRGSKCEPFRFAMKICDPNWVQANKDKPRKDCSRHLPVKGVVYYYPFNGYVETRPSLANGTSAAAAIAIDEDDEDKNGEDDPIIEVFWQGRLLPDSTASMLPFFPKSMKVDDIKSLGHNWKQRIKCMLFFNWDYEPSNNKLKLKVPEATLDICFNTKDNFIPEDRNTSASFKLWLKLCHEKHDMEIRFHTWIKNCDERADGAMWESVTFGNAGPTYKVGDKVKLYKPKSSKTKAGPEVYGVIKRLRSDFRIRTKGKTGGEGKDDDEEEDSYGDGYVDFVRQPTDVYGQGIETEPLNYLDNKEKMTEEAWTKAMSGLSKSAPSLLEVNCSKFNKPLSSKLQLVAGEVVDEDMEYLALDVTVKDGAGKSLTMCRTNKGATATKAKIWVYREFRLHSRGGGDGAGGKKPKKSTGKGKGGRGSGADASQGAGADGGFETISDRAPAYDGRYYFKHTDLLPVGVYDMVLFAAREGVGGPGGGSSKKGSTLQAGDVRLDSVPEVSCRVTVLAGTVANMRIHFKKDKAGAAAEGAASEVTYVRLSQEIPLPAFSISLYDKHDNPCDLSKLISVQLRRDDEQRFDIVCKAKKDAGVAVNRDRDIPHTQTGSGQVASVLEYADGDWMLTPLQQSLLGGKESMLVTFTASVTVSVRGTIQNLVSTTFQVRFTAGLPLYLVLDVEGQEPMQEPAAEGGDGGGSSAVSSRKRRSGVDGEGGAPAASQPQAKGGDAFVKVTNLTNGPCLTVRAADFNDNITVFDRSSESWLVELAMDSFKSSKEVAHNSLTGEDEADEDDKEAVLAGELKKVVEPTGKVVFDDYFVDAPVFFKEQGTATVLRAKLTRKLMMNSNMREVDFEQPVVGAWPMLVMPNTLPYSATVVRAGVDFPEQMEDFERIAGETVSGLGFQVTDQACRIVTVRPGMFSRIACNWDPDWVWPGADPASPEAAAAVANEAMLSVLPDIMFPKNLADLYDRDDPMKRPTFHCSIEATHGTEGRPMGHETEPLSEEFGFYVTPGPAAKWGVVPGAGGAFSALKKKPAKKGKGGKAGRASDQAAEVEAEAIAAGLRILGTERVVGGVVEVVLKDDDCTEEIQRQLGIIVLADQYDNRRMTRPPPGDDDGHATQDENKKYEDELAACRSKHPSIRLDGIPGVELQGKQKHLTYDVASDSYRLPRGLRLTGSPSDVEGSLVIGDDVVADGQPAGNEGPRPEPLRIRFKVSSGPPTRVLVRCASLGMEEWTEKLEVRVQSGFAVKDLQVRLVDAYGRLANLRTRARGSKTQPPEIAVERARGVAGIVRNSEVCCVTTERLQKQVDELTMPSFVVSSDSSQAAGEKAGAKGGKGGGAGGKKRKGSGSGGGSGSRQLSVDMDVEEDQAGEGGSGGSDGAPSAVSYKVVVRTQPGEELGPDPIEPAVLACELLRTNRVTAIFMRAMVVRKANPRRLANGDGAAAAGKGKGKRKAVTQGGDDADDEEDGAEAYAAIDGKAIDEEIIRGPGGGGGGGGAAAAGTSTQMLSTLNRQDTPMDQPLPSLVVWVDTEDGKPFLPNASSLAFQVEGPDKRKDYSINDFFTLVSEEVGARRALVYRAKQSDEQLMVGKYMFDLTYMERRTDILGIYSQGGEAATTVKMEKQFIFNVVAGRPVKLEIRGGDACLQDVAASNRSGHAPDARKARQLVNGKVDLIAMDKGNNKAVIVGPLVAAIKPVGDVMPKGEFPRLEGSDEAGLLVASKKTPTTFDRLELEAKVGTLEGEYELVLTSLDEAERGLRLVYKFTFSTDEQRVQKMQEVQARLGPLKQKLDEKQRAKRRAEKAHSDADRALRACWAKFPAPMRMGLNLGEVSASKDLVQSRLDEAKAEAASRQGRAAPRPAKVHRRLPPAVFDEVKPIGGGALVNVGFVSDKKLAGLLSWVAGDRMGSVLVETKKQQEKAVEYKLKVLYKGVAVPFHPARSAEQKRAGALPMPPVAARGFIAYCVNLVQLAPENEVLRDWLLWRVYGKTMLFDTLSNATAYRESELRKQNVTVGTIVTEDGHLLESSGFVDGGRRYVENSQPNVYGALNADETTEVRELNERIGLWESMLPVLENFETAEQLLQELSGETGPESINALQAQIDDLTREEGGEEEWRHSGEGGASSGNKKKKARKS